jgi:hypothetical protein
VQQAEQVTDDHCVQQRSANTESTKRFAMLLLHLSVLRMGAGCWPKSGRCCEKFTPALQPQSIVGHFTFCSVKGQPNLDTFNMPRNNFARFASRRLTG